MHQDKKGKHLLIRFTAAGSDLKRKTGVFGLCTSFGNSAELCESIDKILKQFCTPGFGCPAAGFVQRVDETLLPILRSKINAYNADAAEDCNQVGRQQSIVPMIELFLNVEFWEWDVGDVWGG